MREPDSNTRTRAAIMGNEASRSEISIGGLTLDQLNRREIEVPDHAEERMYLKECHTCGPSFDGRYFGDALYHMTVPDHRPLGGSPGFEWQAVDEPEEELFHWQR